MTEEGAAQAGLAWTRDPGVDGQRETSQGPQWKGGERQHFKR